MIVCDIQPVQNLRVLQYVGADRKMEWGKHWITTGFEGLEKRLGGCAGEFCVGDSITMADVCLVPQIYNAKRFSVEMEKFPIISRIGDRLNEIEEIRKARPEAQEDCPEDLRN